MGRVARTLALVVVTTGVWVGGAPGAAHALDACVPGPSSSPPPQACAQTFTDRGGPSGHQDVNSAQVAVFTEQGPMQASFWQTDYDGKPVTDVVVADYVTQSGVRVFQRHDDNSTDQSTWVEVFAGGQDVAVGQDVGGRFFGPQCWLIARTPAGTAEQPCPDDSLVVPAIPFLDAFPDI